MSKAKKILTLLSKGKTVKEVAKATKSSEAYVYYVRWIDKKGKTAPKKKKSKIVKAVKEMKQALDVIEVKKDPKAEAWLKNNRWFGKSKSKTAYALGLHQELVDAGVDAKSDEYWKRVDEGMRGFNKPLTTTQKAIAKKLGLANNQYPATDLINSPPHYTDGGVQTLDFIEAKDLNYRLGNVVKYVSRAGKKNTDPVQDLEKAMFYLKREIDLRKSA